MAGRIALAAVSLVVVAVALPSCGAEGDEAAPAQAAERQAAETSAAPEAPEPPEPSDHEAVATCDAGPLEIDFVQADELRIRGTSGELAFASYTDRAVSEACRPATLPRRARYNGLGPGIYRDVGVTCDANGPVTIHVQPVVDGDNTLEVMGSNVGVYAPVAGRPTMIVSAVMKNREHAAIASRIYIAPSVCRAT